MRHVRKGESRRTICWWNETTDQNRRICHRILQSKSQPGSGNGAAHRIKRPGRSHRRRPANSEARPEHHPPPGRWEPVVQQRPDSQEHRVAVVIELLGDELLPQPWVQVVAKVRDAEFIAMVVELHPSLAAGGMEASARNCVTRGRILSMTRQIGRGTTSSSISSTTSCSATILANNVNPAQNTPPARACAPST